MLFFKRFFKETGVYENKVSSLLNNLSFQRHSYLCSGASTFPWLLWFVQFTLSSIAHLFYFLNLAFLSIQRNVWEHIQDPYYRTF